MEKENKTESISHHEQNIHPTKTNPELKDQVTAKTSRKKKITIIVILVILTAYVIYAYLNNSPDPTTWESLRGDYKNTK